MNGRQPPLTIRPAGGDTATPLNLQKRIRAIEQRVGPVNGLRLLDCGCGEGDYVRALTALGADAWGIEYSEDKLEASRCSEAWDDTLADQIQQGDLEKLLFESSSFDIALLNEVLEHVPDDRRCLAEISRVLKPGGALVVFSPNRLFPFETHGVALRLSGRKVSPAVPFIPWVPLRLGQRYFDYWARNYWPWELRRLLADAGFEVVDCGCVWQTFENISGQQPRWMSACRPLLRRVAEGLEGVPLLRALGASQLLVARRRGCSGSIR